jgi:predicted methyltransferase
MLHPAQPLGELNMKCSVVVGIACCCLLGTAQAHAAAGSAVPVTVTQALADAARPADEVQLDPLRKPAEVIAFAGLKSGDRVVEFMSGNGYFTRIFSRVVGPTGRVYAFIPAQQLVNCSPDETAGTKALERDTRYRNVDVLIDAADRFAVPEPVEMVWTAQNYHDLHDKFMKPIDVAALNAAIFRALKPGGTYIVIDHAAAAGSGLRDTETLHRIDPEAIRAEVTAAGFVFEAQSEVLRNADDSHSLRVFDPAIRHHTDQIVFKFRKPGGPAGATVRPASWPCRICA